MTVTQTFLEMTEAPGDPGRTLPSDVTIARAHRPTAAFYRWLYGETGRPWRWTDRHRLTDDELMAAVDHPDVHVCVLYRRGTPAGFCELDFRRAPDVHLCYFGLMPHAIGTGIGAAFLDWTVRHAWAEPGVDRLWLTTCSLDHPRALEVYEKAGFVPYRRLSTERPDAAQANARR